MEAERLVSATGLRYPALRVVKAGEKIPAGAYTETVSWRPGGFTGTANTERVVEQFARGATIVIQALHVHHRPIAEFCRGLEADLGHPVQTNAYYTPKSAQGLPVHHDTHDVFCLQVAGEKRWLVYDPVLELPLKDQKYSAEEDGEPGDPVLDVTLRPGDTLYLPRGWLHKALTSETDSLHLTVGVNAYTWLDAVRGALEEAAREEVELRRSVEDDDPVDELLELVRGRLGADAVSRRKRERFVSSRRPIRPDQFDQLRALDALDVATELERRATVVFDVVDDQGEVALVFEGRRVVCPGHAREAVEAVAAADEPFRLADLPGSLDEAGRVVLGRRLVREGFLRVRDA